MLRKTIEIICNIFTIVFSTLSFLGVSNIEDIEDLQINTHTIEFRFILIAVIAYILLLVFLRKLKIKESAKVGSALHSVVHNFRNLLAQLKRHSERDTPFRDYVTGSANVICREIVDFYRVLVNKDVSVCIKLIEPTSSRKTTSINEMKVRTLCRAGKDSLTRTNGDAVVKIVDNTDFYNILSEDEEFCDETYFVSANLKLRIFIDRFLYHRIYKNTTKNYAKKYNAVAVVPIRIDEQFLTQRSIFEVDSGTESASYRVFGFLCIDYKKNLSNKDMKDILHYAKSFGDMLYQYFDEVNRINEQRTRH